MSLRESPVKRGQAMAQLFSRELAEAQSEFVGFQAQLEAEHKKLIRAQELVKLGAASREELEGVAGPHQADGVELGLFVGGLFGALAHLVALIEQFDFLQLFKRFRKRILGLVELALEFVGRPLEVFTAGDRRLRIGRIGLVSGIVNVRSVLLDHDLPVGIIGHALELGDHHLDLRHLAALFINLKALQADQCHTRLHRLVLPRSPKLTRDRTGPLNRPHR